MATPTVTVTASNAENRSREVRRHVLAKVTIQRPLKVDIKPIGGPKYRINVWVETGGQSDGGFFTEKRIAQSFVHTEA
jgi:hypothetical protein